MSDSHHARDGGSLRPDLQALVNQVGLQQGTLKLVVHQGFIESFHIETTHTRDQTATQKPKQHPTVIRLSEAEPFVDQHLQPLVSDLIGDYGSMQVNVNGGHVVDWLFSRRQR